jgi:hypothetical protein
VFEEHPDDVHIRCTVCQKYDPLGLGGWIKRATAKVHLRAKTHEEYTLRLSEEEQQKALDDQRRAAPYEIAAEWDLSSDNLRALRVDERPSMFEHSAPLGPPPARQTMDDLDLGENDFAVELPAPFDFAAHAATIHEEAALLYARLSEARIDDADDEDIIQEIEEVMDAAVKPASAGRELHA